jgi:hypothetical protein
MEITIKNKLVGEIYNYSSRTPLIVFSDLSRTHTAGYVEFKERVLLLDLKRIENGMGLWIKVLSCAKPMMGWTWVLSLTCEFDIFQYE